ncbi:MAG: 4-(cytidine 5'-diphospho)-2-C-methyl-D-erythritol kinase [Clostridia bacterium]|nr:4-(cytidine 5'-diphospho)-2-C-methyl-D-erythritol kinase [Clostridia bacterium]
MKEIYMKARAKVNLNLEILEKRKDNYHNIKSVFQKINLYDEIYIQKSDNDDCQIQTNVEELNNKENIIYKAYLKLKEQNPNIKGINVKINKKIPMQAGLAGGSTDCASFILGMNKLFNLKLSKNQIKEICKNLGADVVPCLYNRAILAQGIGDIITKINTDLKYYILIIKPEISCNTKTIFQELDTRNDIKQIHKSEEIINALESNNIEKLSHNLYNVFENVIKEKEIIQNLKKELIKNGAIGSAMTGTGSCVYGIFQNKEKAKKVYNILKDKYQIYICTSYNSLREKEF